MQEKYNVGIYCRLSRDDERTGESVSIENQKIMLSRYVQEKRKEWKKTIRPDMVEHLVFLDESGVSTNLTRLYGRAFSSQRAVDHAPLNTPQTTTVLSSIRLNGEKAFIVKTVEKRYGNE